MSRTVVLRYAAGANSTPLCINYADDDIACEADVSGEVRLMNSTNFRVVEPFVAAVTIKDDDGE